jgi:hypothetical protein
MNSRKQCVRVVLVSPADVVNERKAVKGVVDELNRTVAANRLALWRWETDARPGMHAEGGQGVIDDLMDMADADVVIGVFWKRFGTPTGESQSGTEHELRRAWAAWKEQGRPEVMLYFCQRPYTRKTREEIDQWGRVLDFQQELPEQQLWWTYTKPRGFEALLREHLTRYLIRQRDARQLELAAEGRTPELAGRSVGMDRSANEDRTAKRSAPMLPLAFASHGAVQDRRRT